jgi:hypothetical protein
MELSVSNPVRLDLLEHASADVLAAFFRPYAAFLRANGIAHDRLNGLDAIARLHGLINESGVQLPEGLANALLDVADLAANISLQGSGITGTRQMELFGKKNEKARQLSAEDMAFSLYLQHGAAARLAVPSPVTGDARRFITYLSETPCILVGLEDDNRSRALSCHLSDWYVRRNRGPYVEVRTSNAGDLAVWHVIHGKPRLSLSIIKDDEKRDRLSVVPDKEDVIQFDRRSGVLSVNAQYPAEADFYRQEIGELYFGSRERFVAATLLSADPVLNDLDYVLSPDGIPGLQEVCLREVRAILPGSGNEIKLKGRDVRGDLVRIFPDGRSACVELRAVTLALRVEGRRQPKLVTIEVPNKLTFDRRTHSGLVREYLISKGLLRLPTDAIPEFGKVNSL